MKQKNCLLVCTSEFSEYNYQRMHLHNFVQFEMTDKMKRDN